MAYTCVHRADVVSGHNTEDTNTHMNTAISIQSSDCYAQYSSSPKRSKTRQDRLRSDSNHVY